MIWQGGEGVLGRYMSVLRKLAQWFFQTPETVQSGGNGIACVLEENWMNAVIWSTRL